MIVKRSTVELKSGFSNETCDFFLRSISNTTNVRTTLFVSDMVLFGSRNTNFM